MPLVPSSTPALLFGSEAAVGRPREQPALKDSCVHATFISYGDEAYAGKLAALTKQAEKQGYSPAVTPRVRLDVAGTSCEVHGAACCWSASHSRGYCAGDFACVENQCQRRDSLCADGLTWRNDACRDSDGRAVDPNDDSAASTTCEAPDAACCRDSRDRGYCNGEFVCVDRAPGKCKRRDGLCAEGLMWADDGCREPSDPPADARPPQQHEPPPEEPRGGREEPRGGAAAPSGGRCPFTEVRGYNMSDGLALAQSSQETYDEIASRAGRHGAGWWLWKPLVMYDALTRLPDGGVLVYADAGHHFEGRATDGGGVGGAEAAAAGAVWACPLCEKPNGMYCRKDAARRLVGDDGLEAFLSSPQVEASKLMLVKSEATVALVREWRRLALEEPWVFMYDERSELAEPNRPDFRDHRHDQAVLSALLWRHQTDVRGFGTWLVHDRGPGEQVARAAALHERGAAPPLPAWWTRGCDNTC